MYNYIALEDEKLEFVAVASEDEISDGERILFEIDGESIVLFKIEGAYFAIADLCSHDDGPVAEGEIEGHEVICPRHGAHFDLHTGKALTLPAVVDIPAYPVRVAEGEVLVGIPLKA